MTDSTESDTSPSSPEEGWLPPAHRKQIVGLAAMVFLILASYELARSPVESLFVEKHTAAAIPQAWLVVAIGSVFVFGWWSHWAARIDLVRGFGLVSGLSALVLAGLLLACQADLPGSYHALFLWKDIYIVLLIEIFWSFANQVMPVSKASRVYGLFLVVGSVGSFCGGLLGGQLAVHLGTRQMLWSLIPLLGVVWLGCRVLHSPEMTGTVSQKAKNSDTGFRDGVRVLLQQRVLWCLLLLIGLTQVAINLIDYQTQHALELYFPDTDERTQIMSQIYASISVVSLVFQLATSALLRGLGVPLVMLLLPGLMALFVASAMIYPRMITVAITKVASKAFDYSIFRAAKEIFYIPLSHEEKTQGKAFVDMMTYRVSKGVVSLFLLVIGAISMNVLWSLILVVLLAWMGAVVWLVRCSSQDLRRSSL